MKTFSDSPVRADIRSLALIILLALALRFGLLLCVLQIGPTRYKNDDSPSYLKPAETLVRLGRFSQDMQHPEAPEVLRTPGYPLFLAAVLQITGSMGLSAVIAQNLLWCLAVLPLVWALGRHLWSDRAGVLSSLLLALDPSSIVLSQLILSETVFAVFLTAALYTALRFTRAPQIRWVFLFGLLMGAATLIRPIALFMVCFIIPGIIISVRKAALGTSLRQSILYPICFLLPWLLLVGGWSCRNYKLIGRFDLGPVAEVNLLYNHAAGVVALKERDRSIRSFRLIRERMKKEFPFYTSMKSDDRVTAYKLAPRYRKIAWEILKENRVLHARLQLICMRRFFTDVNDELYKSLLRKNRPPTPPGTERQRRPGNPLIPVCINYGRFYLIILYTLVLTAWWRRLRNKQWSLCDYWLLSTLLYCAWLSASPDVSGRFRVPVMPILALYAGSGLETLMGIFARRLAATEKSAAKNVSLLPGL